MDNEGKNQFIMAAIRSLKTTNIKFESRVEVLPQVWSTANQTLSNPTEETSKLMQWLISVTLETMLMAQWTKLDAGVIISIKSKIEQCVDKLGNSQRFQYRCNYIIEQMENPWGSPILRSILNEDRDHDAVNISPSQLAEEKAFFEKEHGCMIMMRLEKLVETKCDRMALNFCQKVLQAIRNSSETENLYTTVTTGNFQKLQRILLSLMVKLKQFDALKATVQAMDFDTLTDFLRYSRDAEYKAQQITDDPTLLTPQLKRSSEIRLLKHLSIVNRYALNTYLGRLFAMKPFNEDLYRELFVHYLTIWVRQNRDNRLFHELFKELVSDAVDNVTAFIACDALNAECPTELELMLQVFIITLTREINFLETKKYDETYGAPQIMELERQIAPYFLRLGEYLREFSDLTRECVLTAFSMHPNTEYFSYIVIMAKMLWPQLSLDDDGVPADDIEVNPNDLMRIDALNTTIGTNILDLPQYDAILAPSTVLDSLSSISEALRHDISCLLYVSRIKRLTWALPWVQLKELCKQLLCETEKMNIVDKSTALANSRLQYLDLNYADYRNLRPHEYPGIERGYEIYANQDDSSDNDGASTDSAPESKILRQREQRRLSARKLRHRKIIEKGVEDRSKPIVWPTIPEARKRPPRKRPQKVKPATDVASTSSTLSQLPPAHLPSTSAYMNSMPSTSTAVQKPSTSTTHQYISQSLPSITHSTAQHTSNGCDTVPCTPITTDFDCGRQALDASKTDGELPNDSDQSSFNATQDSVIVHSPEIPKNDLGEASGSTTPASSHELPDRAKGLPEMTKFIICPRRGRKKDPTGTIKLIKRRGPLSLKVQCSNLFKRYGLSAVEDPKKVRKRRESMLGTLRTPEPRPRSQRIRKTKLSVLSDEMSDPEADEMAATEATSAAISELALVAIPNNNNKIKPTAEIPNQSAATDVDSTTENNSNSNSMQFGPMIASSLELLNRRDSPSVLCDYASAPKKEQTTDPLILKTPAKSSTARRTRKRSSEEAGIQAYPPFRSPSSSESLSPDINIYKDFMIGNEVNPRALNDILGIPFVTSTQTNSADSGELPRKQSKTIRNSSTEKTVTTSSDDNTNSNVSSSSECERITMPLDIKFLPTVLLERLETLDWPISNTQTMSSGQSCVLEANMQREPVIVRNAVATTVPSAPKYNVTASEHTQYNSETWPNTYSSMIAYQDIGGNVSIDEAAQMIGAIADGSTAYECTTLDVSSTNGSVLRGSPSHSPLYAVPHRPVATALESLHEYASSTDSGPSLASSTPPAIEPSLAFKSRNPLLAYRRPPKKKSAISSNKIVDDYLGNTFTMPGVRPSSNGIQPPPKLMPHQFQYPLQQPPQPLPAPLPSPVPAPIDIDFTALNTLVYVALTPLEHTEFYRDHQCQTADQSMSSHTNPDGLSILTKHCKIQLDRVETTQYKAMYERALVRAQAREEAKALEVARFLRIDDDDEYESDDDESHSSAEVYTPASMSKQRRNYKYDDDDDYDYYYGRDDLRPTGSNVQRYQTNRTREQQQNQHQQNSQSNDNARNQQNCRQYLNKTNRHESPMIFNGKSY